MGLYLNPGFGNFNEILKTGLYVDKTMMIDYMNRYMKTEYKYICFSRPRRCGKTVAGNMLAAYYSKGCDSSKIFAALKIAGVPGYAEKMNRYNVIKIDLNAEYQITKNRALFIDKLETKINKELAMAFPNADIDIEDSLALSILNAYADSGEPFIIIIDEYDILVREQVPDSLFSEYLRFLNGLFKNDTLRPAIALAYLTGILPIVRERIQSKLNNFVEYTMLDAKELAEFVGFTSQEVQELCTRFDMDFETCRHWYNGYRQHGFEIYTPRSVAMAMWHHDFDNYWTRTSSYEAISDPLRMDFDGIQEKITRMLAGERVPVDTTFYINTTDSAGFKSCDDVLTFLIHLGYLAFDAADEHAPDAGTCRIPNIEIRNQWNKALSVSKGYEATTRIIQASQQLLEDTAKGDADAVARALDESHIHVTSNRSYNNEDALQSAIYLAYLYAVNDYTVIREMTTGKGFADVVFIPVRNLPARPAMVIELKRNGCTESALDQIREKKYFDSLAHYQGNLLFVGINYDEKEKTHTCKIEQFEKDS